MENAGTQYQQYRRITEGPPSVEAGDLGSMVHRTHGIGIRESVRLPGETDANYVVSDQNGTHFVLKISEERERPRVEIQNSLLDHLRHQDPTLPVPRTVRTSTDDHTALVQLDGRAVLVRLLSWLPGEPLTTVHHRSDELYQDIGRTCGRLSAAMATARRRESPDAHYWDLRRAGAALDQCAPFIDDPELVRDLARARSVAEANPVRWEALPHSYVHHDLNALNIMVNGGGHPRRVTGIVDFGDVLYSARVCDLAVLLAALTRGTDRPVHVARVVTAAYHEVAPLTEEEIDALFGLWVTRAAVVAATTARLAAQGGHGDPRHRSQGAPEQLRRLVELPADFATASLRMACGVDPHPAGERVRAWIAANGHSVHPVVRSELVEVDLSASSEVFDVADPRRDADLAAAARSAIEAVRPAVAVARYAEPWYLRPILRTEAGGGAESVSTGVTLFVEPGTAVAAPLAGVVDEPGGPDEVVVRHQMSAEVCFWTRVRGVTATVPVGDSVTGGQQLGYVTASRRTDLPAHLVAQLAVAPPARCDVPDRVRPSEFAVWSRLAPDASVVLGAFTPIDAWQPALPAAMTGRDTHLARTHPTYFSSPINMVRARDCFFYDENAHAYLDALNNVTLVGHGHPRLVEAATRQLRRLNTNSRFVYDVLTEYAERLTATLPDGLDVVYFLNSGSEANDLALRMARYVTGREDIVVSDHAYHGYTALVSDVSPARYKRYGKPDFTHATPIPDRYRGAYGYDDPNSGAKYAELVGAELAGLESNGRPAAAFIYESLLAGGGQVVLPAGYLRDTQKFAMEHGTLTIADEVQVGFGRLGEAFWGFQTQGRDITPDFVTMGKAMGNGFPVAAMVTTREISERFDETGRFFSTYGGNPASCAVGLELLKVMDDEGLQENALVVGRYLRERLGELAERHRLIGDVRGQGLYNGVEFVVDRDSKEPASVETLAVCERLKNEGILVYPTGPDWNILKIKPPLSFTRQHADTFVTTLDMVLERSW